MRKWMCSTQASSVNIKVDPLEAAKTFKWSKYGPYCAISGTEPSSVALYKTATITR